MIVQGKHYRTIWIDKNDRGIVKIIDQRHLPHKFVIEDLTSVDDFTTAIQDMHVRGAGLIGATAGYGMYIAALNSYDKKRDMDKDLEEAAQKLIATRPTAINLEWAVNRQLEECSKHEIPEIKVMVATATALRIADEDAASCKNIGVHGVKLIEDISEAKNGDIVNILTHCNAGWLAFVDYGSATSPIYAAHDKGIPVHVWVDETRPRNQGASLTAWELGQHGVPHNVIVDNAGGLLMQKGLVDLVIVGTDRTTYTGDVCNKIGTYLKALASKDNNIPFYVALPSSTFDWNLRDGRQIPLEQRDPNEVKYIQGLARNEKREITEVLLTPIDSPGANYAFDITPARLVTGLITERGICKANEESILSLYPEKRK